MVKEEILKQFIDRMNEEWRKEPAYVLWDVNKEDWREKTFAFWLLNKLGWEDSP